MLRQKCLFQMTCRNCVLECSGCKQKKRMKERREFECTTCNRQTTLVPRGSITTLISRDIAEKMLSMTAEHIFETTLNQLLPIDHVHKMLSDRLFRIQLKKSSWRSSNDTQTTVSIMSYVERKPIFPPSVNQRDAKKLKPLSTSEVDMEKAVIASDSSSTRPKDQPPTPAKKP
ncbi:uncharacterized protein LOC132040871 isoform X2 [Lycium ferocissimum]|uniref:uncharacterized protein LOC132040871 isoform X2 n=1 Tax=Lycium ferocissimum TaxID=112874 RepID=UPI002816280B|nr:uncharacterized protein LOC132040871 isoform X2 [Lycium ferocissimum]